MSGANYDVPPQPRGGVWADDVEVYGDLDERTLDFLRSDPRDGEAAVLVARIATSRWCILKLRRERE